MFFLIYYFWESILISRYQTDLQVFTITCNGGVHVGWWINDGLWLQMHPIPLQSCRMPRAKHGSTFEVKEVIFVDMITYSLNDVSCSLFFIHLQKFGGGPLFSMKIILTTWFIAGPLVKLNCYQVIIISYTTIYVVVFVVRPRTKFLKQVQKRVMFLL